ncbi:hypothetical protein ACMX25_16895 [Caballeronia sp. 15715]
MSVTSQSTNLSQVGYGREVLFVTCGQAPRKSVGGDGIAFSPFSDNGFANIRPQLWGVVSFFHGSTGLDPPLGGKEYHRCRAGEGHRARPDDGLLQRYLSPLFMIYEISADRKWAASVFRVRKVTDV